MERPDGFLEGFDLFSNLTALAYGAHLPWRAVPGSVGTVVSTEIKPTYMI